MHRLALQPASNVAALWLLFMGRLGWQNSAETAAACCAFISEPSKDFASRADNAQANYYWSLLCFMALGLAEVRGPERWNPERAHQLGLEQTSKTDEDVHLDSAHCHHEASTNGFSSSSIHWWHTICLGSHGTKVVASVFFSDITTSLFSLCPPQYLEVTNSALHCSEQY